LSNGNVLIVGGAAPTFYPDVCEIYDPSAGTFTTTGAVHEPRTLHAAMLLASGQVVIAAGIGGSEALASTEFYDPATGVFTSNSVYQNVARYYQATTQLADGRVLLTGGINAAGSIDASAEIYDPTTKKFALTGSMSSARQLHTATL